MQNNWKILTDLVNEYNEKNLHLEDAIHNLSLITFHSTAIEGSTLTEVETQVLIEDNITAHGKDLNHHLMVIDHYNALQFIVASAKEKRELTIDFLKEINAKVNAHDVSFHDNILGKVFYNSGEFRNARVKAGSTLFDDHDKAIANIQRLVIDLNKKNTSPTELVTEPLEHTLKVKRSAESERLIQKIYELSFEAHFQIVSIHPWFDGNGRTSRLVMNFIQEFHNCPKTIIFKEDKAQYIEAIIKSREENNINAFIEFSLQQAIKHLQKQLLYN